MAIIQTSDQIRYLRRKNLGEEARIIGNYYSDCIAAYGIDCIYRKMDMSEFSDFKGVVDNNVILKRAYGYDITPQYSVSADMIAFAEVDSDIFNLNKIGYTPNTDITLVFDSTRFACDMAPAVGRYKEYRIDESEVVCEVPPIDGNITSYTADDGSIVSGYVSCDAWPYELGLGYAETYRCGVLEGRMRCILSGYELGKEQTVVCDPYEHADFRISFPKNEDLYYSLKYSIANDDYLETMLFLTFRVDRVPVGPGEYKYVLHGRTHGSVLFFDLDQLGKYSERIHPAIGDIVEIDFPDENNREKYEITDCFDKQLTQDGVNPLLHKYVWKCKARRYINSYEDGAPADSDADERLVERNDFDAVVQEQVADSVSLYDDIDAEKGIKEDAAYGGYDGVVEKYDRQDPAVKHEKYDYLDRGEAIDIMRFGCGSRLVTNGYDLVFVTSGGDAYVVAQAGHQPVVPYAAFECGLKWIKATDSAVVFVNIEGDARPLAVDSGCVSCMEISIDDMYRPTVDREKGVNSNGDSFIKFKGTRTLVYATQDALFVKLASDGRLYQLI